MTSNGSHIRRRSSTTRYLPDSYISPQTSRNPDYDPYVPQVPSPGSVPYGPTEPSVVGQQPQLSAAQVILQPGRSDSYHLPITTPMAIPHQLNVTEVRYHGPRSAVYYGSSPGSKLGSGQAGSSYGSSPQGYGRTHPRGYHDHPQYDHPLYTVPSSGALPAQAAQPIDTLSYGTESRPVASHGNSYEPREPRYVDTAVTFEDDYDTQPVRQTQMHRDSYRYPSDTVASHGIDDAAAQDFVDRASSGRPRSGSAYSSSPRSDDNYGAHRQRRSSRASTTGSKSSKNGHRRKHKKKSSRDDDRKPTYGDSVLMVWGHMRDFFGSSRD